MAPAVRRLAVLAAISLALGLAACAGDTAVRQESEPLPPPSVDAPDGGIMTLLHPFTREHERAGLRAVIAAFEAVHPEFSVRDEAVSDLEAEVRARIAAGMPPDAIVASRPDVLERLDAAGSVVPLDELLDTASVETAVVDGLLDLVTFDGTLVAVPLRVIPNSLVWFNPLTFEQGEYPIPTSWDELLALSDRMAADGLAPWCIGIESGAATGWVVADWMEDVVLRGLGGAQYDRWVAGDLPFSSPEIRRVLEDSMLPIWSDASIFGGRSLMARQPFNAAAVGILGEDPDCGMHRQALVAEDFIRTVAPDARVASDYDFFALPPIRPGGQPMIGAADFVAVTSAGAGPRELMDFLATAEAGEAWAALGGFVSPFPTTFDATQYPEESSARAMEILKQVTEFRIDGSDLMPVDVGASARPGSFWSEMAAWARDERTLTDALENIDVLFAGSR